MFKKLRNKFLILGMTVTSLVLITSFTIIYMATYDSIQRDSIEKLKEASANPFMPGITDSSLLRGNLNDSSLEFKIPADYKPSFTLLLDMEGNLVDKSSFIDLSEDEYAEAAQKAWHSQHSNTPIRIGGRLWQYSNAEKGSYVVKIFNISDTGESKA